MGCELRKGATLPRLSSFSLALSSLSSFSRDLILSLSTQQRKYLMYERYSSSLGSWTFMTALSGGPMLIANQTTIRSSCHLTRAISCFRCCDSNPSFLSLSTTADASGTLRMTNFPQEHLARARSNLFCIRGSKLVDF